MALSSKSYVLVARSDALPIDPSLTAFFVQENFVQHCIAFAMLTLIVYNAMTTFDKEVHYFWKRPMSIVGLIFFLNRYVGLLGITCDLLEVKFNISFATCRFSKWTGALCGLVTMLLIDYILLLRVLALYSRNKKMAAFLSCIFILEVAAFLTLTIYFVLIHDIVLAELAVGAIICAELDGGELPMIGIFLWVPPVIYAAILLFLALYKAPGLWQDTRGPKGIRLVKVLLEDQIIYFIMVIFCSVANIIVNALDVNSLLVYLLNAIGSPSLLCVLGNHLLIHLKEAGEKGLNEGTSYTFRSFSAIDFRQDSGDNTFGTSGGTQAIALVSL